MKRVFLKLTKRTGELLKFKHKNAVIDGGVKTSGASLEVGKYCVGLLGVVFGWYGIALYAKHRIPEDDRPPRRLLMSRCEVTALPTEQCEYPSPLVMAELSKRYGFSLPQAAWAASHFCPIEFHVHLIEDIVASKLQRSLQRVLRERKTKTAAKASTSHQPFSPSLAQEVVALLEDWIIKLETTFPTVAFLRHVPYEAKLEAVCDVLGSHEHFQELTVDNQAALITEALREVIYEFLVANWEASRYFDPTSYKEGLFGPRRTYLSEGVDVGTRSASYLLLDKYKLRLDTLDNEEKKEVLERREKAVTYELSSDRRCLSEPSREARARQFDMQKIGMLPENLRQDFKQAKKTAGKSFQKSPMDHFHYTPSLEFLPNKEDPYATFLSPDEFGSRGLPLATLQQATEMVQRYGVVRIRQALPKETVLHLKRKLFVSPVSARDMGDKLIDVDNNIGVSRRSAGRVTAYLRASSLEPFLVELQRVWMPLIYALFPTELYFGAKPVEELSMSQRRIHDWKTVTEEGPENLPPPKVTEIPTPRLLCSAIQLTSQDKNAPEEGFAVDNASPSLTVLVALDDMHKSTQRPDSSHPDAGDGGALQLIPGTHHIGVLKDGHKTRHLWQRNWRDFFHVFFRSNGPVTVSLNAGDVVVWDSRVFRRMLSNGKIQTSSYMIFRYDFIDTPAPSQALPQLLANKLKSRILFWSGLINRVAFSEPQPVKRPTVRTPQPSRVS